MIKIKPFAVNPLREVTYIVSDSSKECVIIDAGADQAFERQRIDDYIGKEGLKVTMLINTHCHFDHILSVRYFKEKYNVPFAIGSAESKILAAGETSAGMFGIQTDPDFTPSVDLMLEDGADIQLGNTSLKVIATPGHTPGGVCFFESGSKSLFVGDTLFAGSIGRTDLPYGDYAALMNSIVKKILPLGGDVTVYPGHGNHTTLAHEAMHNPFIVEVMQGEVNIL